MRFGFYLPVRGPLASHEGVVKTAQRGEKLGFSSGTIADHIVFPTAVNSKYPYAANGIHPSHGDALEQLSLMAYVAGKTERLRLITSVMVMPHRNPVLSAKMIATIDVLSQGRVTLGVGVGWMREEFLALGAADFDRRGAVTDEYIEIWKKLWTGGPVAHDGAFYKFGPVRCEPLPAQRPHPPIWIGGHTDAALRRAARHGDGWHPIGADPEPLELPAYRERLDTLKRLTEAAGRDFSKLTLSFVGRLQLTQDALPTNDRKPFAGSPAQVADDVAAYAQHGVSEMIFDFRTPDVAQTLDNMERFARDVMPLA
ncbi:MAG: LLM class F420-dependent oxidoreductase [Proteobacteria bacterium]|nr:LLM class F420-dependent oxidoreductase [Pseudomonadota bacterium]